MSQNKKKRKSPKIRWKLFGIMLVPTLLLLVVLWVTQTVLLGIFYAQIKTEELKNTTEDVIDNIEGNDIHNQILFWSSNGNINIRVVDTSEFKNLYTTGEAFDSVTYGMGIFGLWEMYDDAMANNGELVRYYSENEGDERFSEKMPEEGFAPEIPAMDGVPEDDFREFRQNFHMVPRPAFFDNAGRHDDLLYVKVTTLSDGSEIMVVADTRISPLDSTVVTLRRLLIFASIVTVIVSLALSFLMAKRISKPIEKTTKSAKVLAEGRFDVKFEGSGYREIEELNETLNYTSSELGKVDGLRRELVANVSHDMRTPLTMISGYAEVMRDIPGENNAENLQVIIDEANRLNEFVNNVLDLSKLQNGMEKSEMTDVDITEILIAAADRYEKLMGDNKLQITLEYSQHVIVKGDETKLTRVVHNLADNAINYARDPKRMDIRQIISGNTVRIEISDNGEGIASEELPYIWDRYYRTDKNHKRNVVGSGLGLSIVKEILKLHSARYGVFTKENKGSTFWFELKIAQ